MNVALKNITKQEWFNPFIGVLFIFLLCILFSPTGSEGTIIFLKFENFANIFRQFSEIGIISIGMTLVIITSGIDLSVGSVLALSATVTAFGIMDWQLGLFATIFLVLAIGVICGLLSGVVITFGKLQPFIVTLAMMTGARGFALYVADNNSRNIGFGIGGAPESFRIFTDMWIGIPVPVYIFIAVVVLFNFIVTRTKYGRHIYSVGSNEQAAHLAGLNVGLIKIVTYIFCGALTALAGIIHSAQLLQGNPNDGVGFELDAIAAVVIGGTSLMGGKGNIIGTFCGVLMIGLLSNILGLHGIQKDFQLMLKGLIIVAAVLFQNNSHILKNLTTKK